MPKRRDKTILKSTGKNLQNVNIDNLDDFYDVEYGHQKKAIHRGQNRNVMSLKADMDLEEGLILEIMTNNFFKVSTKGKIYTSIMSGRLKQFMFNQKRVLAVGDKVKVDISNGTPFRIEEIIKRKNRLLRYTEGGYQKETLIASNMDCAVVTVSCLKPMLKLGLIDRFIVQACSDNIEPVICINKVDLVEDKQEYYDKLAYYKESGYQVFFVSSKTGEGMDELKSYLQDQVSVFSGQSGVGKSSIINYLMPGVKLAVSEVSDYNEKGRHTTTSSRLLEWEFGGFLVDTPGIKTLALKRDNLAIVYKYFPGFSRFGCYFNNCTHTHEKHCGVKEAVEQGIIPQNVYESFLRIIE